MLRHSVLTALALLTAAPALAAEGSPGAQQNIVRVRPVMVPIVVGGHIEKYAPYEITLEIADAGRTPEIQSKTPRLQDTVTAVVYEAVDKGWVTGGVISNGHALRQRLEDACNALLGKGTVGRVLITPATRGAM
ncbi:hypothetical protein [Azospirillum sp. sgz301742]